MLQHKYEKETVTKKEADKTETECIYGSDEQNMNINPTTGSSIDWRVTQKSLNQIYKDLEVYLSPYNELGSKNSIYICYLA